MDTDDPTACDRNQAEHEARFQRVQASPFFAKHNGRSSPPQDYDESEGVDEFMSGIRWDEFAIVLGAIAGVAVVLGIGLYKLTVAAFVGLLMLAHAAGLL